MTNGSLPPKTVSYPPTVEGIAEAAKVLKNGGLVAFPTETVFGLGAVVTDESAVQRIFEAKQRPVDHPLIAHIANPESIAAWVKAPIPAAARQLMDAFWPGPLTLVLPKSASMPDVVTGGQDTVGIRCPSHPVARALLEAVGLPVAAPSANRFGRVSPTCGDHVRDELDGRIHGILEGEPSEVGIESTIVACVGHDVVLLRPGSISAEDIELVIGAPVKRKAQVQAVSALRVSGNLEQHYSPQAKVVLSNAAELAETVRIWLDVPNSSQIDGRFIGWSSSFADAVRNLNFGSSSPRFDFIQLSDRPASVAHDIYRLLRDADHDGKSLLVIEKPPATVAWEGVADRLKRASA